MAPADHVSSCRADQNTMGRIEVRAFRLGQASSGEGDVGKAVGVEEAAEKTANQILSEVMRRGGSGAQATMHSIFDEFRSDLLDRLEATDPGSHGNRAARARFRAKEARRHRHAAAV